jgi:MFS family permease
MTHRGHDGGARPTLALVSSASSQTAALFPAFAVGALAPLMGEDLGFGAAGLGSAVAFFFLLAAVTSPHAGTLADRLGPQRSLRTANILSGAALLAVAIAVRSYWMLLAALAIGAIGLTIVGPGCSTMVAQGVPARRHGAGFGVLAAAAPLSVLLAGLAVPTIGLTLGWRWAFGIAIAMPLAGFVLAPAYGIRAGPNVKTAGPARGLSEIDYGPLNLIGVAAGLGSAATTSMAAFFVSAAIDAGLAEGLAGNLLAVASGAPVATRIAAGYLADRFESGHLRIASLLLGASTAGYVAASIGSTVLVPVGAIFALGVGWGWSGLMLHSVVRAYRDSPGAATGMTFGGLNVGGVVGPFAFGLLVEQASYGAGFLAMAGCALLAAIAIDASRRRLIRMGANP